MIFYFSGTGNSKGIANLLARDLGDTAVNIIGANPKEYHFTQVDRIGFVFPVYAYLAPKVMQQFASCISTNGAYTFAVPTFSNAVGCALEHFSETVCPLQGGFGIKMPDNMPVFDKIVETEETAREKLQNAAQRYPVVLEKIRARQTGYDVHYGPNPREMTWEFGKKWIEEPHHKTELYHIHLDKCVGCGICQQVCPANMIHIEKGLPIWKSGVCYMCMACLNHCPTEAIEYGPYSEGKYRYLFPGLPDVEKQYPFSLPKEKLGYGVYAMSTRYPGFNLFWGLEIICFLLMLGRKTG